MNVVLSVELDGQVNNAVTLDGVRSGGFVCPVLCCASILSMQKIVRMLITIICTTKK